MTSPSRPRWLATAFGSVVVGSLFVVGCSSGPGELETAQPSNTTISVLTGTAPRATGGFPSVLIFKPQLQSALPIPQAAAVLDQYNTDFHPRVLVVRVGQTVQFKNSEDTLHNVHVIDTATRETAFNVATPAIGSYDYVFETASVFDVSCGVHPSMAAIIVVTETPHAVVADPNGAFSIAGVPSGDYTVTVWNLDPSRRSQQVLTIDDTITVLHFDNAPEDVS